MSILENIQTLCKERGISIPKLEQELGFGKGSIYKWDKISPSIDKVKKVADYFGKPLDLIFSMNDDHEAEDQDEVESDFISRMYSQYSNHDLLVMLFDFLVMEVSYMDRKSMTHKFLPQYMRRFQAELERIGEMFNISIECSPDYILKICRETKGKEFTLQILQTLQRVKREVDSDIKFGRIPPPVPVTDIGAAPAQPNEEDWTEEELTEIEQFKEFLRMKRQQKRR